MRPGEKVKQNEKTKTFAKNSGVQLFKIFRESSKSSLRQKTLKPN